MALLFGKDLLMTLMQFLKVRIQKTIISTIVIKTLSLLWRKKLKKN